MIQVRNAMLFLFVICIGLAWSQDQTTGDNWIWWEGESPSDTNLPQKNPFAPKGKEQAGKLSGGAWIGVQKRPKDPFIEYKIDVPKAGNYDFHVRKFWKHGPFRWRFDQQDWQEVSREAVLMDSVQLRKHLGANWVFAGKAKLDKGQHTLRIELLPSKNPAACFDCFSLSLGGFEPRGHLKPDAGYPPAKTGFFNFTPDVDTFGKSPIDLRVILNEKRAGDGGFIQSKDDQFIQSKTGKPIRFWGVVSTMKIIDMQREDIDSLARWLAKHGVNLIRMHGGGLFHTGGPNFGQIDKEGLDKIHYTQKAFADVGIYTLYSIYFQHWVRIGEHPDFRDYKKDQKPFVIHFIDPKYNELHRNWFKALLTTTNPYTKRKMADDPAVMGVEILNEDNFFFYTFNYKIMPIKRFERLERMFGEWAEKRYGSIAAALQKWDQAHQRDDAAGKRLGLAIAWEMANRPTVRNQDCARFLSGVERGFYRDMKDYIRKDCGFKASICGSNMKTVNGHVLGPIERYDNIDLGWMDNHGYFGSNHKRTTAGYGMNPGDFFDDRSAIVLDPKKNTKEREFELPFLATTYNNNPTITSEWAWNQPNAYRAEAMLMAPALSLLSGVDGLCHFNVSTKPQWASNATGYWALHTPVDAGQYPAAALMYRLGLVQQGPVAVQMNLNVDNMYALKGVPLAAPNSRDMNRARDDTEVAHDDVDGRLYAVGQVRLDIGDMPTRVETIDAESLINDKTGTIKAATGQIRWETKDGIFVVNAPAVQGATGFFRKNGAVDLGDITIQSDIDYGTIVVVSMDGKPIRTSSKLLLQVMSEQQNTGFNAPGKGYRKIVEAGGSPIIVRKLSGTVKLKRGDAAGLSVTPLDWNGYPQKTARGAGAIDLKPDIFYYVIER